MAAQRESWFISESELDDNQYNIKRMSLNNSYVVKGCAGSGKTILAIWRAIEVLATGEDCRIIVYTKALKKFMKDVLTDNPYAKDSWKKVMTYDQWKYAGMPTVTHLIVDEVQDFTLEEIESFQKNATISMALFGDTAQKLYPIKTVRDYTTKTEKKEKTLSVEEIAATLNLPIRNLKINHRLPKKIARFAQHLNSTSDPLESQCKKEGARIPTIAVCKSDTAEIEFIINQITSKGLRDVGILLPDNEAAERLFNELLARDITCEVKYRKKKSDSDDEEDIAANPDVMTLDFMTDNPKILTYHSAKGLQFENVFLPFCSKQNSKIKEKTPLYVACTRASQELTITCTNDFHSYLEPIPNGLYEKNDFRPKR
ncbi:MAG: hypothetical protein JWP12_1614 [Bacteroidetes bacterium]|nr:hypothetical protein [Bacteroidota bacterium]